MSDYTDIQPELDDFENAVYGEEVRDSMVSAIKKIHDLAESAAGAPDATTATAGQAPIADGAGGWQWGEVESGDTVPTNVRQAIFNLLNNAVYRDTDLQDEKAIIQSWATEITAISVSPATLSMNGAEAEQLVATTQPAGGLVTWESSDTSVAEVDGGLVTSIGNGTCTITARCGGKSATCAVTVTGFASLLSIEATYTQSGTVYDTDSLDDLKSDLVVMGTYSDSQTLPITGYTLSGTLSVGTSTITVAYGGFTDTFTVTVSRAPVMPLYNWDLTSSLTDTVGGITATTTATFTSGTGVVFPDADRHYLSFGQVYSRNRTYEIDVLEIGATSGTNHRRLLSFGTNTTVSSGGACFLNTKTKGYGWKFYLGSAWDSAMIKQGTSSDWLYNFFNGKTVKIYLDSDGIASVYSKTIGADDSAYELVGTSGAALNDFENGIAVVGATYNDNIGPATITGFRVYSGSKGGE